MNEAFIKREEDNIVVTIAKYQFAVVALIIDVVKMVGRKIHWGIIRDKVDEVDCVAMGKTTVGECFFLLVDVVFWLINAEILLPWSDGDRPTYVNTR
jgi:hypothetical protein